MLFNINRQGQHMTLNDWTQCDFCHFPALYSYFKAYVEKGNDCPMCFQKIKSLDIKLIPENKVKEILQGKLDSIDQSECMIDEDLPSGLKRTSAQISDESNLANVSLTDMNKEKINGYEQGENMLPLGLIGGSSGSGGMVI
jgi:hypothetical protein